MKNLIRRVRRISVLILLATMLIVFNNQIIWAENNSNSENEYNYNGYAYIIKDDSTIAIIGWSGEDTVISIPSKINGIVVSSLEDRAFYGAQITSVEIPDSITEIGINPFSGCYHLQEIIVDDANKDFEVVNRALIGNNDNRLISMPMEPEITEYVVPEGIEILDQDTFTHFESLISVILPDSLAIISDYTFFHCKSLTEVSIPDGVSSIGKTAFGYCESLKEITLPSELVNIGELAFEGCIGLTSIQIPSNVNYIEGNPFAECTNLSNIEVSSDNEEFEMRDGVLYQKSGNVLITYPAMSQEKYFTVEEGVTGIGAYAFFCCSTLENIELPDSINVIGKYAFGCCEALTSIRIPSGVSTISEGMLHACTGLVEITIPDSVTNIEKNAFYRCEAMTEFVLPEYIETIGRGGFTYCRALKNLIIPGNVKTLGAYAFMGCDELQWVKIPNSVTEIGEKIFYMCSDVTIVADTASYAASYARDNEIKYSENINKTEQSTATTPTTSSAYLEFGDLLDFNPTGGMNSNTLVIKAKIGASYSNEATIAQNYHNIVDLIKNQHYDYFEAIDYWAVADMTDGSEQKVVSFLVSSDCIQAIKNGDIVATTMEPYLEDLWIHPSLRS